ncbi:RNA 2',3'-cyclic phosphodiesterase [Gemmata sp. G18]|uniref:RNA 2',3'-cyclic phosphodiesterase n=1 Tax=Gemmata palustris TaxID=2822762 RepID=A0ABS5BZG4_9BACT|nr:RNA 2',3'-cyclic phosphodiesterase [Gemmata palustris]MBP3959093.1 RNA 2',3'-cyclic phosphodiesterase [Gemmata palustris]
MGRTRTFIGIDIGDAIRGSAVALQKELTKISAGVKWTAPESMHITLLFLGEVDDRELHPVCKAVKAVAAGEAPFSLRVSGVGAFPNPRRPKVLWGGVTDGAEPLQRLYTALEEEMLELGCYRTEERGYTPHLTLGRINSPEDGVALVAELPKRMAWQGGRVAVGEVIVYSSEMDRDGPVYTVMGRAPLTGK